MSVQATANGCAAAAAAAVVVALGAMAAPPAHGQEQEQGPKLEAVRFESGAFTDGPGWSSSSAAHGTGSLRGRHGDWSYALGARLDALSQHSRQDFDQVRLDYTENFLRWQQSAWRITVGTQNLMWGRVDEISPIDRTGRVDLSRGVLDKLPDRRRAVPAVRTEYFGEGYKLDGVVLPVFDEAVMPDQRSAWSPVDPVEGRILGIGSVPGLAGARIVGADVNAVGGAGVRFTAEGNSFDYGLSVQRVRQSQPYYKVAAGSPVVLQAVHPWSTVVGAELEADRLGASWRMEFAVSSDVPVTTPTFAYRTAPALDLVIGSEFFPGDKETRVTLQLAARRVLTSQPTLDRIRVFSVTGDVEHPFANGRWRADLRFAVGLNRSDVYINPSLTYTGFDRQELYVGVHVFGGASNTLGGFYKHNDFIAVGWKGKF